VVVVNQEMALLKLELQVVLVAVLVAHQELFFRVVVEFQVKEMLVVLTLLNLVLGHLAVAVAQGLLVFLPYLL
jgi:hypothetical protein